MSVADELEKLASLKERGLLTEREFAEQKSHLLVRARNASRSQPTHVERQEATRHAPPPTKADSGMPWPVKVGIGAFGVLLVVIALGNREPSPGEREVANARAAIDLCWSDHDRKSLDPATKRFVASTCEMMENDFRTKHRREP